MATLATTTTTTMAETKTMAASTMMTTTTEWPMTTATSPGETLPNGEKAVLPEAMDKRQEEEVHSGAVNS